jgi:hypothetical protein
VRKEASVVIRCNNDERVFRCISSIDADVEIVVVMNKNHEMQQRLEMLGVVCCISPPGNLSLVSNLGFDIATSDKVIITDSDTTFGKNCIREMIRGLDSYDVVRAPLRFEKSSDLLSREIAEARDYVNSLPVVYTPGIGVTKRLPRLIRGFLFDNAIPFAVDANLSYRINKEGVPALFLRDVWIVHSAEDVHHDLHAARRIGAGNKKSVENLYALYPTETKRNIKKMLKGVKLRQYPDVFQKKGVRVFAYQILWDLNYYVGYYIC